jgi:hypothetical protein
MVDNSDKGGQNATDSNNIAPLQIEKVRNVISQIKTHSVSLAHEGVDINALSDHIATIEGELEEPSPRHSQIRDALINLQMSVGKVEEKLISSGALTLLNQILGTGVPS